MPHTLLSLFSLVAIIGVCGLTAFVGGARERIAAVAFLAAVLVSVEVQQASTAWDPFAPLTAIDVLLMAAFCALAWRPRRGWPVWAVALQGLTLAIDVLRAAEVGMQPYTYLAAVNLSTYGLTAVIGYAGWAAWRRRRSG